MSATDQQEPAAPASKARSAGRWYATVWRWHFYAGLVVAPFLLILAVTGAIYLFNTELNDIIYPDLMFVDSAGPGSTHARRTLVLTSVERARLRDARDWHQRNSECGRSFNEYAEHQSRPMSQPLRAAPERERESQG